MEEKEEAVLHHHWNYCYHQMKSWRAGLFAWVNKSLFLWERKEKSHSSASVHNSHPQPQIDLESLFKIIKMKKNIEEKSYKATHTQQKKKLRSI